MAVTTLLHPTDHRPAVYAASELTLPAIDLYKEKKKSGGAGTTDDGRLIIDNEVTRETGLNVPLDITTWLPFSAGPYHISPRFEDYVLKPVIILPADLPNRNAVAFPLNELIQFNPDLGQLAYKTWKGKPTFYEHQNNDITKAYGVIADSFLRKMIGYGNGHLWKVLLLLMFDRTKNPDTVNRIISGDLNSFSMGAYVQAYTCSYCEAKLGECPHLSPSKTGEFYILNGKSRLLPA
jgi:hypothetical protein